MLRNTAATRRRDFGPGAWLIVVDGEAVGLISFMAPAVGRAVEIGFGVARGRRRLGHATGAVRTVIELARADPRVNALTASCAKTNAASAAALARASFAPDGARDDPEDGPLRLWRLDVAHG